MSVKIRQNGVWVDIADSNVSTPTTNLTASGANYETVTTTLSGNNVVEVSGFPSYTNRIVSALHGSAVNGTSGGKTVGHVIEFKTASGYWSDNNPGTYTGGGPYSVVIDYQTYNYSASAYATGVSVFDGTANWSNYGGTAPWVYTQGHGEQSGAVLKMNHYLVFERIPGSNSWTIHGGTTNYQNTANGIVWNNNIQGIMEFSEPVTGYRLILADLGPSTNRTKIPVYSWTAGNLKTTYEGDGTVNVAESNDVGQGFFVNDTTLTTDTTLPSGKNVGVFGPYSIASGTTLTVPTGTTFSIV